VPGWSISLYYFTFFGALGLFWPFFSLYLAGCGLSPTQISRVLALSPVLGLLTPPLIGLVADARHARGFIARAASVCTAIAFSGFFVAHGRPALYATAGVFAFCRAPLVSLVDASAIEHVRTHGGSYGRLRLWGSLGFLLAVLAGGALLESTGIRFLLASTAFTLIAAAACTFFMPAPPPSTRPRALGAATRLIGDQRAWWFLGAVLLAQIANGAYDACFTLHLARLGFGTRTIGVAYAVGVGAEILLLFASGPVLKCLGASRLFALSLATAAVRWFLLSRASGPAEILALQPLHGVTFGFYYASAVTLMREQAGAEAPTAAQGLFAAVSSLGSLVGVGLSGQLFERAGSGLFVASSVAASLAAVCAGGFAARRWRG
jgi:PPP family 3-phenylpropionic acid transporter